MRQFITIASNAFMELVRQPVFLLLMTASVSFEVFLSCVNYFGFGDDHKLVKNSVMAVMFMSGLFGAVLSASSSVAREIRSGTALAVLSKPVGRAIFIMAKFAGLALSLTVLTYVNMIGALLASRMAFDSYGAVDSVSLGVFAGCVALAYLVAGFSNFFLRRVFVADAVFALVVLVTLSLFLSTVIPRDVPWTVEKPTTDWRIFPASVLLLFALWILAGLALACSTRFDAIPTLSICTALFLIGLMSDYLFGRRAEQGVWWASILYTITPNWQLFWLADVLDSGKKLAEFPWSYLGKAFAYMLAYVGAAIALALVLFEDRELN